MPPRHPADVLTGQSWGDWLGGLAGRGRQFLFGDQPSVMDLMQQHAQLQQQYGTDVQGALADPRLRELGMNIAGNFDMLGTFGGVKAKTAPLEMLARAKQAVEGGADARSVWQDTGWFKGADDQWRFEIDDSKARLFGAPETKIPSRSDLAEAYFEQQGIPKTKLSTGQFPDVDKQAWAYADEHIAKARDTASGAPASSVLQHDDLYQAYPGVADITTMRETMPGLGGSYRDDLNRITYGGALGSERTTMLHELQHAVQKQEGLARGGDPATASRYVGHTADPDVLEQARTIRYLGENMGGLDDYLAQFPKALPDGTPYHDAAVHLAKNPARLSEEMDKLSLKQNPHEAYRRLAGEAEARAVQKRMDYTPQQRRGTFPLDDYDVPISQLIVRR